jgi:glycosyltransferase involved in cell wall biosynthesis
MAELVTDGVNGLHFPPGDAAALAETLLRAADAELCHKLASGIRPPADLDTMAGTYLCHYRQLLQEVSA